MKTRKIYAVLLSIVIFTVLCVPSMAAADENTSAGVSAPGWQFGGADYAKIAGQDGTAQGQNGWYYMWSPETNKGGALDATQMKECVTSEVGSCWFAYGGGALNGGYSGWIPDIYTEDTYDCWASNNWWQQKPDGTMAPAVVTGAGATSVLGWKAPVSGLFSFDFDYTAGAKEVDANSDGVTVSVTTTAGSLYSKATSKDKVDTESTTVYVNLNAGEFIYFCSDPNTNGGNDVTTFEVKVNKTGNYINNKTNFQFGGEAYKTIKGQDGTAQGQNGWYYMWSPETNMAGVLDVSKIKKSDASDAGSCWFAYGGGALNGGYSGWIPDIYTGDTYDCWGSNNWWQQKPDGTMTPAVVTGAGATSVLGWRAPAAALYSFDFGYTAGAKDVDANSDGVTISVATAAGKIYSKATSKDKVDTEAATVYANLKKGEYIYFCSDPNTNGGNDVTTFDVSVNKAGYYVDNAKSFRFGGDAYKAAPGQDGTAQGQNGWYYMWSPQTNMAGVMDVSKIEESVASDAGSCWFAYGGGALNGGYSGWIPDIYTGDTYDCWANNNWWQQMPDGTMAPAVVTGAGASSVLGWKAQSDGHYLIEFKYEAGAKAVDANSDGVTLSVATAAGNLYTKTTSKDKIDTGLKMLVVDLKAGEYIYFMSDPNANGGNDVTSFEISVHNLR